ncbi:KTSC domain-containing protein [Pelagerythrobacter rhizovicinus]|nr:KTSC domain-containing protein [Pelagerythrobacter rhizovicinus]
MPSTAIARFAYHPALGTLDVQFVGGSVYRYFDLPEDIAQALARADSKGGYFNRAIRDRHRFERLRSWESGAGA